MKNKAKSMIAVIAIGISLTTCKHIDQSKIQSYTDENRALEQKVSDMRTFKNQILSEDEKKHSDMIASIDPKKKATYEKDVTLKSEMNILKEEMEKTSKAYEENYNYLYKGIQRNNSCIAEIPNSEQNEEAINSEWEQNMSVFNGMMEANNHLLKEMTSLSQQYNELAERIIKKYGKTETANNSIKKKKK